MLRFAGRIPIVFNDGTPKTVTLFLFGYPRLAAKMLRHPERPLDVTGNGFVLNGLAGGKTAPGCAAGSHLCYAPLVVRLTQDPLK